MTLGDKLQRLALLSPKDVRAIEILVDDALARAMAHRKAQNAMLRRLDPTS